MFSQSVGIGTETPDSSAILDVHSTSQGVLLPRVTTTQRNNIASPAMGLMVFDTDKHAVYVFDGVQWLPMLFSTNPHALPPIARLASDGLAADRLGFSATIDGEYAAFGAPYDDAPGVTDHGSVYVFFRQNGAWVEQAKLTASDGTTDDFYGASVSLSGDYLAIGASGDDVGGNMNQGSVYLYHRGSGWTTGQAHLAKITASDGQATDLFGVSVSLIEDYLIVGSMYDDIGGNGDQGSAYVYFEGAGWTTGQAHQAKLTANDGGVGDNFGISVSLSGSTAIIGAAFDDVSFTDQGSAYIFSRSGTMWSQTAKLTANDGGESDLFGFSVSIDGDYAAIGAQNDNNASTLEGSAYIYFKGAGWINNQAYQAKLTAPDNGTGDLFGNAVSLSGDYVIIGAQSDDSGIHTNQGSAYVYKRTGTNWNIVRKIDDGNGQAGGFFGHAVDIDGFDIVIGAFLKYAFRGEAVFLNIE